MIIEVTEPNECSDCVFCEELIYCGLRDGDHIEFDNEYSKAVPSFCPLQNQNMKVTNKVKVIER